MEPVFTTFDRNAMPENLLTVAEWRYFARQTKGRSNASWAQAAKDYAKKHGGALVMRADDTLICLTRLADGRLRQKSYKPGTWGWEKTNG